MTQSKRIRDRRVDIRLPPYQHRTLMELSKKHGTSLSTVIRALLKKSLDEIIDDNGDEKNSDLRDQY